MTTQIVIALSFTIGIPFVYGLVVYKHLPMAVRMIVWLLGFGLATEVAAQLARVYGGYNLEILNIYNVARAVLLGLFFYLLLPSVRFVRWLFVALASGAVIESILHAGYFASLSASLINIVVFFCCLYCYIEYVSDKVGEALYWLLGVVMFYHLSGFMYFGFWAFADQSLLYTMGVAWSLANFGCNIMYVFALWKSLQYSTSYR